MKLSLHTLFKKSSGPKTPFRVISYDALRDWKKIVYFSAALFLVALAWSGYVFWTIQSSGNVPVDTFQSRKNILNTQILQSLGEVYSTKADAFQGLVDAAPVVVDPAR